jgi:hypothetical protein
MFAASKHFLSLFPVSLLYLRVDVDIINCVRLQILAGVTVVPLISVYKTVRHHVLEDSSLN